MVLGSGRNLPGVVEETAGAGGEGDGLVGQRGQVLVIAKHGAFRLFLPEALAFGECPHLLGHGPVHYRLDHLLPRLLREVHTR